MCVSNHPAGLSSDGASGSAHPHATPRSRLAYLTHQSNPPLSTIKTNTYKQINTLTNTYKQTNEQTNTGLLHPGRVHPGGRDPGDEQARNPRADPGHGHLREDEREVNEKKGGMPSFIHSFGRGWIWIGREGGGFVHECFRQPVSGERASGRAQVRKPTNNKKSTKEITICRQATHSTLVFVFFLNLNSPSFSFSCCIVWLLTWGIDRPLRKDGCGRLHFPPSFPFPLPFSTNRQNCPVCTWNKSKKNYN